VLRLFKVSPGLCQRCVSSRARYFRFPSAGRKLESKAEGFCASGRKQDVRDFVAGKSGKAETRGQRKCKKLQLDIDMEHNSDKVATAICSEKKYQNN
jgi:hypothetical protein